MPIKSGIENCGRKQFERGFLRNVPRHFKYRESDPASYWKISRRPLNALTDRETAYLDYIARIICRYS